MTRPVRIVDSVVTTDGLGRPVAALPVRVVEGPATDELGRPVDVLALEETSGPNAQPVRIVETAITTDELGRPVAARAVSGLANSPADETMQTFATYDGVTFNFTEADGVTPKAWPVGYYCTGEPFVRADGQTVYIGSITPECVQMAAGTRAFWNYANTIEGTGADGATSLTTVASGTLAYATFIHGTQVNPGSRSWMQNYRYGGARAAKKVPDAGGGFPPPTGPGALGTLTNSAAQTYTAADVIAYGNAGQGYDGFPNDPTQGTVTGIYDDLLNVDPVRLRARGDAQALAVTAGDSVVKAVSKTTAVPSNARGVLNRFVILTVVQTRPRQGAFRPPYACDPAVKLAMPNWRLANLYYGFLQNIVPPVDGDAPTAAQAAGWVKRPLELSNSDQARAIAPTEHHAEYGRDIWRQNTRALMWLHHANDNATKEPVLRGLVQRGIDVWGATKGGRVWMNNGGHNAKCKTALVVAALALGHPELVEQAARTDLFQEDIQLFIVSEGGGPGSFDSDILRKHTIDNGGALTVVAGGAGYAAGDQVRLKIGTPVANPADWPVFQLNAARVSGGAVTGWAEADCVEFGRLLVGSAPDNPEGTGPAWPTEAVTGSGAGATIRVQRRTETRLEHELGSTDFVATYNRWSGGGVDAGYSNGDYYATYANMRTYDQAYRGTNASNTAFNALAIRMCVGGVDAWNNPDFFEWGDRCFYGPKEQFLDWLVPLNYENSLWAAHRAVPNPGAPEVATAYVRAGRVAILFDQYLHESYIPGTGDFALGVGSDTVAVTYVEVRGKGLLLLPATPIADGTAVRFTYVPRAATALRNFAGAQVAALNGHVLRAGTGDGAAPVFSLAPVVTGTTAPSGDLTTTTGTASGSPVLQGRWYRDGVATAVTGTTYTKTSADAGQSLTYVAEAINGWGVATSVSNAVAVTAAAVGTTFDFNEADGTALTTLGWTRLLGDATPRMVVDAATTGVRKDASTAATTLLTAEGTGYKTQRISGNWISYSAIAWIGVLTTNGGTGPTGYFLRRSADGIARLSKYVNGVATSLVATINPASGGVLTLEAVVAADNSNVVLRVLRDGVQIATYTDSATPITAGATSLFVTGTAAMPSLLTQVVTYAAP